MGENKFNKYMEEQKENEKIESELINNKILEIQNSIKNLGNIDTKNKEASSDEIDMKNRIIELESLMNEIITTDDLKNINDIEKKTEKRFNIILMNDTINDLN